MDAAFRQRNFRKKIESTEQVRKTQVEPFISNFQSLTEKMTPIMKLAVERALNSLAARSNTDLSKYKCIMDWAHADNGYLFLAETAPEKFYPKAADPVPRFVLECLQHIHTPDNRKKGKLLRLHTDDSTETDHVLEADITDNNHKDTEVAYNIADTVKTRKRCKVSDTVTVHKRHKGSDAHISFNGNKVIESAKTKKGLEVSGAAKTLKRRNLLAAGISHKGHKVYDAKAHKGHKVDDTKAHIKGYIVDDAKAHKGHKEHFVNNVMEPKAHKKHGLLDSFRAVDKHVVKGASIDGCSEESNDSGIDMSPRDVENANSEDSKASQNFFDIDITMAIEDAGDLLMENKIDRIDVNMSMTMSICNDEDDRIESMEVARNSEVSEVEAWLEEYVKDSGMEDTENPTDIEDTCDSKHPQLKDDVICNIESQLKAMHITEARTKIYRNFESHPWKQSTDHLSVGSVVWALFGKTVRWPAIIISEDMTDERILPSPGMVLVFWLSSLDITKVKIEHVMPFYAGFLRFTNRNMRTSMKTAVVRALNILSERCDAGVRETEHLMEWALADDGYLFMANREPEKFYPNPDSPVPSFVLECLQHLYRPEDLETVDVPEPLMVGRLDNILKAMGAGRSSETSCPEEDENVMIEGNSVCCIACLKITSEQMAKKHPLFEGHLCKPCAINVQDGLFGTDEDGSGLYCVVCGHGGSLVECDKCRRTYCYLCVNRHAGNKILKTVLTSESWLCFCCTPHVEDTHGNLKMRENSRLEVVRFADEDYQDLPHGLRNFLGPKKRPIRVLSLFDGIGTGKYVMDNLGFVVDKYYAAEIDPDAETVAFSLGNVDMVGDVEKLDEDRLKKLCPIDLLIGGPPCNDLSIVNANRKGFEGSGKLVWEYVRIYQTLQRLCSHTNHVFFLMENTGHMLVDYQKVINETLKREPAVWDAFYFTGMKRRRYFWGNIPGLKCPPFFLNHITKDKKVLKDAVCNELERKASVEATRTLTTMLNSQTVTNGEEPSVVTQDGLDSTLLIFEMERLFGFSGHHTDVGRLSNQTRRELLGRSWCVPVIEQILRPLKEYFLCKED